MNLRDYFRKIGRKGGLTRTANMTPEQRKTLATKAARARWARRKPKPDVQPQPQSKGE